MLLLASGSPCMLNTDGASLGFAAHAQQGRATGVVRDANGEPLVGATVAVKGTTRAVSTDVNGRYSIQANPGNTLIISYVGQKTANVKVANGGVTDINLESSETNLDELVVVGYGQQKKANLTGAVSSVNVEQALEGRQIADVGRGLQGTTAGLNITIPNGEVGSDPTIKIRGQIGSINGSANPLILLDNVEIPSIQLVNPNDIESISVLKDAAASSIYGSKAAFGVILITTKKGANTERVDVSYQGNFAWQNIAKEMKIAQLDGLAYRVDAMQRTGSTIMGAFWYVDQTSLENSRNWEKTWGGKIGKNDPFVYGRDWYVDGSGRKFSMRFFDPYDYMINKWAGAMSHNIGVNGKSGRVTYSVGLGYLDQNGLLKPSKVDDFRRYNASARLSIEINKYLTFRAGVNYSKRNKRYAYATNSTTADPWYYLYRWDTTYPMGYDENGNEMRSPASELHQANTANIENNYLSFTVGATANILPGWHINLDYTYSSNDQIWNKIGTRFTAANTWGAAVARYDADGNRVYVDSNGAVVPSTAPGAMPAYDLDCYEYTGRGSNPDHIRREITNSRRHTLNITTDYALKIGEDHQLNFLIGMNKATWDSDNNWSQITNLTDIVNPSWDKTIGTQTSSGNLYWDGQLGFFGRVNYALKDKYLFEANVRHDGSSKFPKGLKWRTFPSFSVGWRIGEEKFMNWAKPALTTAKLRASWGSIGDQSVSNSLYVSTLSQGQMSWLDATNAKIVYVGTPSAIDANITWQRIETTNVGVDLSFFGGRLNTTFEWYQRDTKDMIVPGEGVSLTFGASAPSGNYGKLRTRGWELEVGFNHRFRNGLGINFSGTLSDATSKILAYGSTNSIDSYYVGKTYGELWGYTFDRLYQKDDFVWNSDGTMETVWVSAEGKVVPQGTAGAKLMNKLSDPNGIYEVYFQSGSVLIGPGDIKYKDTNGDGQINPDARMIKKQDKDGNWVPGYGDLSVVGNTTPRYEYGFRLGLDFKGIDFSIFFQGIGSRKIWGSGMLANPGYNLGDGCVPQAIAGNYWTEERTDAFWPRPYNLGTSDTGFTYQVCDHYALNMAYLRCKNITLGYTLPTKLTQKAFINKARIYFATENLFTIDKLNGLPIDPEVVSGVSMFNNGNYNSGRTGMGTPAMMNISVGVQLNF